MEKLQKAYTQVRIGDPAKDGILCGPLHTPTALLEYQKGVQAVLKQGGKILTGGKVLDLSSIGLKGNFVEPTITSIPYNAPVVQNEIFVPILHTHKVKVIFFSWLTMLNFLPFLESPLKVSFFHIPYKVFGRCD